MRTLEDLIKDRLFLTKVSTKGWYRVLCKVCNDHGRKGKRAGFRFDNGVTGFSCFNCGTTAKNEPGEPISKNFKSILNAFGIDNSELAQFSLSALENHVDFSKVKQDKPKNYEPREIEKPEHFQLVSEFPDDPWAKEMVEYLRDRKVDPQSHPFMFSTDPRWKGRLIIPVYKNGRLIFYQGRDLTETRKDKYISCDVEKQNIIFGFDRLFTHMDDRLYVTEGFFDALPLNGVAIFGNTLTEGQKYWLERSPRDKVLIPDRWGYGKKGPVLANQFIDMGWGLSLPDFGNEIKDINSAICKFGRLYTFYEIGRSVVEGDLAKMRLQLYVRR